MRLCDWRFAVVLLSVGSYMIFTFYVTEWRLKFRQMNDMDSEANTKAIDGLLNFETVKYFNEAHEATRYDQSMGVEAAMVQSR